MSRKKGVARRDGHLSWMAAYAAMTLKMGGLS